MQGNFNGCYIYYNLSKESYMKLNERNMIRHGCLANSAIKMVELVIFFGHNNFR